MEFNQYPNIRITVTAEPDLREDGSNVIGYVDVPVGHALEALTLFLVNHGVDGNAMIISMGMHTFCVRQNYMHFSQAQLSEVGPKWVIGADEADYYYHFSVLSTGTGNHANMQMLIQTLICFALTYPDITTVEVSVQIRRAAAMGRLWEAQVSPV